MELLEKTLSQVLRENTAKTPDAPFIIYSDRNLRWSWQEFDKRVDELAKALLAIGLKKGDHVGLWATNIPDWNTFLFATARIGAILVTINTNYKLHELDYLIKQADLVALVIVDGWRDSDYVAMVNELVPELKNSARGRLESAQYPHLKSIIYVGAQKQRGMYCTSELLLLGQHIDDSLLLAAEASCKPGDVINMQYTSGTTGFPKGVMLTHLNIINNGYAIGECQKLSNRDIVCLPVPLFHCFGLVLGMMAILTHGAAAAICEQFDPLLVLATCQKEGCTALYGVYKYKKAPAKDANLFTYSRKNMYIP